MSGMILSNYFDLDPEPLKPNYINSQSPSAGSGLRKVKKVPGRHVKDSACRCHPEQTGTRSILWTCLPILSFRSKLQKWLIP